MACTLLLSILPCPELGRCWCKALVHQGPWCWRRHRAGALQEMEPRRLLPSGAVAGAVGVPATVRVSRPCEMSVRDVGVSCPCELSTCDPSM